MTKFYIINENCEPKLIKKYFKDKKISVAYYNVPEAKTVLKEIFMPTTKIQDFNVLNLISPDDLEEIFTIRTDFNKETIKSKIKDNIINTKFKNYESVLEYVMDIKKQLFIIMRCYPNEDIVIILDTNSIRLITADIEVSDIEKYSYFPCIWNEIEIINCEDEKFKLQGWENFK